MTVSGPEIIVATILREEGRTGVHTHVRQLQDLLSERGTPITLITPSAWHPLLAAGVFAANAVVRRCSGSAAVAWYLYWHGLFLRHGLRRRLARTSACVVYAQSPTAARAALRARTGPHQRVVLAVHFMTSSADEFTTEHLPRDGRVFRWIRRAEQEIIPRADGIVFMSQSARDALLGWLRAARSVPSAVITNFVSSPVVMPDLGPQGDLVTIGALRPLKNHRFLLEVLAEASRAGRPMTLDVFGDGVHRRELAELARSLGVHEQVRWRGFRTDARDYLPGYKIYVHASLSEVMPLAIIEAMAAGLPVIAGDVGGISEIAGDSLAVRFWPLDDPAKAAAVLTELMDREPARLEAARAAETRFRENFEAHVVGARLLEFLYAGSGQP
jgi:glycosyltransferase involved in cell wall biosynthesis